MTKKTIGFFHYQVGRTDGVSLELAKWRQVFEEMGHTAYLFGGDVGASDGILIPEMFHHTPLAEKLYRATYQSLDEYQGDEGDYRRELFQQTDLLESKFKAHILEKGIDFLIPQNVWSVAANPPVGMALARIMRRMKIPALAHNHDFYWERRDGVALTCKTAIDLAFRDLPPRHPLARHAVINSLGQRQLLERRGIEAAVVPNVFDFNEAPWQPDDYNRDLRQRIGLKENDIFVLQATRIVTRKGIELAIDFVQALNTPERRAQLKAKSLYDGRLFDDDSRIVFVLAGYAQDDDTGYVDRLKQKIAQTGIDVIFIADMVDGERGTRSGSKIYS
ncbi:MAG TPA: glycosyltransferase family 4 protein, partial [Chloroflexi bacterium]|nr:glycosyltransferase family 4 protein [Chloroflexota bacterium]